jgi:hypothetical protein
MIDALLNNRYLQVTALVAAMAALLCFGVVGIGRGDAPAFHDVRYFYIAGEMFRHGLNPYDFHLFQAAAVQLDPGNSDIGVYPYPPQSLVFCYLLSLLPFAAAKWIWTCTVIGILVAIAWVLRQWLAQRVAAAQDGSRATASLWIPVIVLGNPFSAHIVWVGQTGIFVLGFLMAAWLALSAKRYVLAGFFLAAASMKPQLSILVILWVLMTGQWRAIAAAAVSACVLLLPSVMVFGPTIILDWVANISSYHGDLQQQYSYLANLNSLFLATGIPLLAVLGQFLPALAVILAAWLAYASRSGRVNSNDVFATLIAASVWLVFGRDYDIAVLVPLLPMFFWHCRNSRLQQFIAVSILALLCVPHRLVERFDIPALLCWRIVLLGVVLLWAVYALRLQLKTSLPARQVHV